MRSCGQGLLRRLCAGALRGFRIQIVYVRVYGVLRRMDKRSALVCYIFCSIRQIIRVTAPSVCRLSLRNACDPGGMRSAMVRRPVIGLFAHSLIHLVFSFT